MSFFCISSMISPSRLYCLSDLPSSPPQKGEVHPHLIFGDRQDVKVTFGSSPWASGAGWILLGWIREDAVWPISIWVPLLGWVEIFLWLLGILVFFGILSPLVSMANYDVVNPEVAKVWLPRFLAVPAQCFWGSDKGEEKNRFLLLPTGCFIRWSRLGQPDFIHLQLRYSQRLSTFIFSDVMTFHLSVYLQAHLTQSW